MFYVNDMDPYAEAQYILEVLQRGNPLKGISEDGGIIQIEQKDKEGLDIVLSELSARGYKILSIAQTYPSGWAVGIEKDKTIEKGETIEEEER